MNGHKDLLVVGAGPAGLEAARAAADCGLAVTLVDEQPAPGGQLLRNVETPMAQALMTPAEREDGLALVKAFRDSGVDYRPKTIVWGIAPGRVDCLSDGAPETLTSGAVIVAPGGMERPVPFPGWTLPGVMGAGGADILLRSGGTLNDGPVVLAGNGPLLLLLAVHLLEAGADIAAWLDTGAWTRRLAAAGTMPGALLDAGYMGKGLGMAWKILRGNIPMVTRVSSVEALGAERLEGVRYIAGGRTYEMPAATLLRHEGIIPRTHIPLSMEIPHVWDKVQRYWHPVCDENGATSLPGVSLAGDGVYVHGGDASRLKGRLAGIAAAERLGVITPDEAVFRSRNARFRLRKMRAGRAYLRDVFAPNPEIFQVPDATLVCRCECVSAGDIRRAVAAGNHEVNEVKRVTRCGMGNCQGRMCGPALAEIAARTLGCPPDAVGRLNIRQPFRPVSLRDYCALHAPE